MDNNKRAKQILKSIEPELFPYSVMYGLDSGIGDFFPETPNIKIEVTPTKSHLLERFVISKDKVDCISPLNLTIGIGGSPIPLKFDDDNDDNSTIRTIVPQIDNLVVNRNEIISVNICIEKYINRVIFTVIGKLHPASFLFDKLKYNIENDGKIKSLWYDYKVLVRYFEDMKAKQRNIPPLSDDMLGIENSYW